MVALLGLRRSGTCRRPATATVVARAGRRQFASSSANKGVAEFIAGLPHGMFASGLTKAERQALLRRYEPPAANADLRNALAAINTAVNPRVDAPLVARFEQQRQLF